MVCKLIALVTAAATLLVSVDCVCASPCQAIRAGGRHGLSLSACCQSRVASCADSDDAVGCASHVPISRAHDGPQGDSHRVCPHCSGALIVTETAAVPAAVWVFAPATPFLTFDPIPFSGSIAGRASLALATLHPPNWSPPTLLSLGCCLNT